MTFGHLVVHITETNDLLRSKAAAVPAPKVDEVKETDSKDKLVAALKPPSILFRRAGENGRLKTSRNHGNLTRTPGFPCLGQHILAGAWADHYARSGNVPALERCVAADRKEIRG